MCDGAVMGTGGESDEEWGAECSDDDKYSPTNEKGVWEPEPQDIKALYEKINNGETLILEWVCPGRKSPSPEKMDLDEVVDKTDHDLFDIKVEK